MIAWILVAVLGVVCGVLAWRLSHINDLLKWNREAREGLGESWAKTMTELVRSDIREKRNTEEILALSNRITELEENGKQLEVSRATNGRLRKELAKLQKQLKLPTKTKKGAKPV